MSNLNIQWRLSKPMGILAILTGFAMLSQMPIIYHAREILNVVSNDYLIAYIVMTIAAVFILTNAELLLFEAFLFRLHSYTVRDYRAPFLSVTITNAIYFVVYYLTYATLNGVELFGVQQPIAQYALCQIVGLTIIMILAFWYNRRQIKE
ncbi:MAG: hypothetical protein FK734_02120 [Asgard group archaeon]|nr:hypothetical protein [Asgard group archaeon]